MFLENQGGQKFWFYFYGLVDENLDLKRLNGGFQYKLVYLLGWLEFLLLWLLLDFSCLHGTVNKNRKLEMPSTLQIVGLVLTRLKKFTGRVCLFSSVLSILMDYGWDPIAKGRSGVSQEFLESLMFNLEDVERATQCFSEWICWGRAISLLSIRGSSEIRDMSINMLVNLVLVCL